jgi:hypothetical protein
MPRTTAKTVTDIKSMARSMSELAVNTLSGVCGSKAAPAAARVSAAVALLDRGWGKADQAHTGPDGGDIRVTIRQIIENVGRSQATPNDDEPPGE